VCLDGAADDEVSLALIGVVVGEVGGDGRWDGWARSDARQARRRGSRSWRPDLAIPLSRVRLFLTDIDLMVTMPCSGEEFIDKNVKFMCCVI
jgi:hypothetical protein